MYRATLAASKANYEKAAGFRPEEIAPARGHLRGE
jgi:hypothetical protein